MYIRLVLFRLERTLESPGDFVKMGTPIQQSRVGLRLCVAHKLSSYWAVGLIAKSKVFG